MVREVVANTSQVVESYTPTQISNSSNVLSGRGSIGLIFVSAASATPTITIYDSATTTTTTKIVDTFTPVAGQTYILPFSFDNGCYVVIGGTVRLTIGTLRLA
jgi:hypothetical protein